MEKTGPLPASLWTLDVNGLNNFRPPQNCRPPTSPDIQNYFTAPVRTSFFSLLKYNLKKKLAIKKFMSTIILY